MATVHSNHSSARVFISYARADGEAYAKYLHDKLVAEGIPSWWDREDLRRTNNWWRKIDEALESVEYLVAVLTPKILNSETCRKEWQWARRKGKCIVPVKAGMSFEASAVPRWLKRGHAYQALDLNQKEPSPDSEWQKLINDLNTTPKNEKVPFMAGDLPEDFVARPEEFNKLLAMLIEPERSEPLAITAALRGAGGYGKTTLATALCHDLRVQEAFDDGILWVTLGEKAENLTGKLHDCIYNLNDKRPDFAGEGGAATELALLLEGKYVLLVVDDVWKRSHLEPFLQGGKRCARLVTTRISDVLPKNARKQNVDAMKTSEAVELLGAGVGDGNSKQFADLARQLGEWPLLIKLVNRYLFDRVEVGEPVADAIRFVSGKLNDQGLTAFDAEDADQRNDAVAKTVGVSLDLLESNTQVPRLFELGVFPEDEDIPIEVIASLWQQTGGLNEIASGELCLRFFKLSLVLELNLGKRTLRLHDAIRKYYHSQLVDSRVANDHLLRIWVDPYALPNSYAWKWYGYHVSNSSQPERLRSLLIDFKWLNAKLNATDVNSLLAEFRYTPNQVDSLRLIESAIRLSAHVLTKDKNLLASQLLGRLAANTSDDVDALRAAALRYNDAPWLEPVRPSLRAAGGPLIRTLEGHSKPVEAVALSADGRTIVSGSRDHTIKVWDLNSGDCLRTLDGHSAAVSTVAISADGHRLVSGSWDRTIKVWDLNSGDCLRTLDDHSESVEAVALSADGRTIVSGSGDHTIKVWDLNSGDCLRTLAGHSQSVAGVALSADGHTMVSGSYRTIKVWDLNSGDCLRTLAGHSDWVFGVALSADGRTIVSGSQDNTIKVWDLNSGDCLRTLAGQFDTVRRAVALSADGRTIVSGSADHTIKVWDLNSGDCLRTLAGHSQSVEAVALSADGRTIVSGSRDASIKVWDLNSGDCLRSRDDHHSEVYAVALSADGRTIVSGAGDRTIKVWDLNSGDCLRTLGDHFEWVKAVALSADGRTLVSNDGYGIIKVWDLNSGDCLRTLDGHSTIGGTLAISADGRTLVSGEDTIKVWDLETYELKASFVADAAIRAVNLTDTNRIIAGDQGGQIHWLRLRVPNPAGGIETE